MKYICSICRYVYDEAKEGKPFAELPDSWVWIAYACTYVLQTNVD